MIDFSIKKNDTLPALKLQFKNDNSVPINLSGCSIVFNYRLRQSNSFVVSRSVPVEDPLNGIAQYVWVNGDTDNLGVYIGEFVITFPSGKELTFPEDTYIIFEVVDNVE
jgi:hypothetical protein